MCVFFFSLLQTVPKGILRIQIRMDVTFVQKEIMELDALLIANVRLHKGTC